MSQSAFCLNPQRRAGFTLIEVSIALAILATILAIAVPSLSRMYDRLTFSLAREDVERAIGGLGARARTTGQNLILRSQPRDNKEPDEANLLATDVALALPEGWRLIADPPVSYRFDGLCLGGKITIAIKDQTFNYRLNPPFCRPKLEG